MALLSEQLFEKALALPLKERLELAESLLSSVDPSDQIDKLWAIEAEDRIDAFENGNVPEIMKVRFLEAAEIEFYEGNI